MPPRANVVQRAVRRLPAAWRRRARRAFERLALSRAARRDVDARHLRRGDEVAVAALLASPALAADWHAAAPRLASCPVPDGRGAVPAADRRALFQLARAFAPARALEIGTHLGASTVHLAAALALQESPSTLTTVDVVDVNDPVARRWARHGTERSPRQALETLGLADAVEFVVADSLGFLAQAATTGRRFDLVFLDGDHAARTLYREIPAALAVLAPRGVIVLHDYYSPGVAYGADGSELPGVQLAVERLVAEGAPFAVVPLGVLPWSVQQPGRATGLALLLASRAALS